MRWDDGIRRPKSWDAPDWLRGSVLVQVYHISVLQQNEYCNTASKAKSKAQVAPRLGFAPSHEASFRAS